MNGGRAQEGTDMDMERYGITSGSNGRPIIVQMAALELLR
jgi:hypothetical protein